jgi:NTE family protein
MGKVVKLDPGAKDRATPRARDGTATRARTSAGVRARRHKTALVLGGGAFTGGVYEIGALRALDLLSVNRTVNQFDVYVGTSAGSFIAALCANGVTPEEMMRVVTRQGPMPFRDIDVGTLLRPNFTEFVRKGAMMPLRALMLARQLIAHAGQVSVVDLAFGLAEALPSGLFSGSGIESYLHRVLSDPDRSDDFRMLEHELFLAATDLDTCERIVLGSDGWDDVPISTAVRASSALPMLYRPVMIKERELVDGGIVSTTNLDIAVDAGARLVIVVNPIVPFVNDFSKEVMTLRGARPRRVSDMGFPQIGFQAFKLLAYQRLHEMARQWEKRYPGVDILLIEPQPDDELMFETSMLNYASRVQIARHGFISVTRQLADEYDRWRVVCDRHGLEISPDRVRQVVDHFEAEREQTAAWRKILEQTTGALLRQSGGGGE